MPSISSQESDWIHEPGTPMEFDLVMRARIQMPIAMKLTSNSEAFAH
jgi:hypothetical protein